MIFIIIFLDEKFKNNIIKRVISLEMNSLDIVAAAWDTDYRVLEIEWPLEDSGILIALIGAHEPVTEEENKKTFKN